MFNVLKSVWANWDNLNSVALFSCPMLLAALPNIGSVDMAVDGPTDDGVAVVRFANEIDPHSALYPLLLPKFTSQALPD